jgi:hypothetical protein
MRKNRMRLASVILAGGLFLVTGAVGHSSAPGKVIASAAIQPHAAIDGDGQIYVAFIHKGNIAVSVSRDRGRSFSQPVIALDVRGRQRGGMQRGPRIGVDARKRITVTCPVVLDDAEYTRKYPTADLYLVTSTDGGKSWSRPLRVNEAPKKAPEALHGMAVAPTGEAHVAWLDLRSRQGRGQDIFYAKVADGRVSKNVKIASTVCECCAPGLAVDGQGNPVIAFREGGSKPSREIFAMRSTRHGAGFGPAVQLNRMPSRESG